MDRFVWTNGLLEMNETLVIQQRGVRLYDGDDKVCNFVCTDFRAASQFPVSDWPSPKLHLSPYVSALQRAVKQLLLCSW